MPSNPQLEAISLKMYKIESRRPDDYRENYMWQKLNALRDKLSVQVVKSELARHKERVSRLGENNAQDSVVKIKQYEKFLERYDTKQKGEENAI